MGRVRGGLRPCRRAAAERGPRGRARGLRRVGRLGGGGELVRVRPWPHVHLRDAPGLRRPFAERQLFCGPARGRRDVDRRRAAHVDLRPLRLHRPHRGLDEHQRRGGEHQRARLRPRPPKGRLPHRRGDPLHECADECGAPGRPWVPAREVEGARAHAARTVPHRRRGGAGAGGARPRRRDADGADGRHADEGGSGDAHRGRRGLRQDVAARGGGARRVRGDARAGRDGPGGQSRTLARRGGGRLARRPGGGGRRDGPRVHLRLEGLPRRVADAARGGSPEGEERGELPVRRRGRRMRAADGGLRRRVVRELGGLRDRHERFDVHGDSQRRRRRGARRVHGRAHEDAERRAV